jgi:ribosomal protein S18 acetylase RimI-like enzyme
MTQPVTIKKLGASQLDDASQMLARAFHEDPMFTFIFPDAEERRRKFPSFVRSALRFGSFYDNLLATEGLEGLALWLPPGKASIGFGDMVRSGMIWAPFVVGFGAFGRFNRLVTTMEKLHKRDMHVPHWYLMILGVDASLQGKGIGSALIQNGLERADTEGLPSYLETMNARNVPFYERHGFEVVVNDRIAKGGPEYWTMRRPARG